MKKNLKDQSKNIKTLNNHLDLRYGKPGTKTRTEFEEEARKIVQKELKK